MIPPPAPPNYRQVKHMSHLIISCLTCGLWLPFWPLVWLGVELRNSGARRHYERQMRAFYASQAGGKG